jgi:hypothetical protein
LPSNELQYEAMMSDQSSVKKSFRRQAQAVARDERKIQVGIDAIDKRPAAL